MSVWNDPFISRAARDIKDHFTPAEAEDFRQLAQNLSGRFGARIVGPGAVLTVILSDQTARECPHASSLWIYLGFFCLFLVIARLLAGPMRQRLRAFLCSTAYAQQMGYRVESLPLSRLGFG